MRSVLEGLPSYPTTRSWVRKLGGPKGKPINRIAMMERPGNRCRKSIYPGFLLCTSRAIKKLIYSESKWTGCARSNCSKGGVENEKWVTKIQVWNSNHAAFQLARSRKCPVSRTLHIEARKNKLYVAGETPETMRRRVNRSDRVPCSTADLRGQLA